MNTTTEYHQKPVETAERKTSVEGALDELNSVHTRPDFTQYCMRRGIDPTNNATEEYANAYAAFVQDFADERAEEGLMSHDYAALLKIGAHFASATHAENEVKKMKKVRGWSKEDKSYFHKALMPQVINYNRQVVDYLYQNPAADIRDVSRLMFEASRDMLSQSNADEVHDRVNALTKGCRTEAMTAKLFDRIGVPYDFGTVAEDARGGDVVITLGGERILVDLKSSLDGMTGVDKEKALDAVEAGKIYVVTGSRRFKLFMKFDKGYTSELADDAQDMIIGAQVMRACQEAISY